MLLLTKKLLEQSRDNSDRKKGNDKGSSFNKKNEQSRKNEMNIKIRVATKQNIPAEKDYNERNSSDGKWNGNEKSLSTNPSTLVRADPLLSILKNTNRKNDQDKIFFPTAPLKNEFSEHNNEVFIFPSVQDDPILRY